MDWWEHEELVSLAAIAQKMRPRKSATTVWRWATVGIHGLVLESKPRGGRLYSSFEALDRFESALAARRRPAAKHPEPPAKQDLPARAAAAGRKLAQLARL